MGLACIHRCNACCAMCCKSCALIVVLRAVWSNATSADIGGMHDE
jgi:hypothetical protein